MDILGDHVESGDKREREIGEREKDIQRKRWGERKREMRRERENKRELP